MAARPIITASHPVSSTIRHTIRVHNITVSDDGNLNGIFDRLDEQPVRFALEPLRFCPAWTVIIDTPASSIILAISPTCSAVGLSQPGTDLGRHGHRAFFNNASANLVPTNAGPSSTADPPFLLTILRTGQPKLMSMSEDSYARIVLPPLLPLSPGSDPKI